MAPNSPACSFIHASMAGSRSTAPSNRSNSVLIISLLSPLLPTSQQSHLPRSAGLSRFLRSGCFYREARHLGLWWHSHSWLCSLSAVAASLPRHPSPLPPPPLSSFCLLASSFPPLQPTSKTTSPPDGPLWPA